HARHLVSWPKRRASGHNRTASKYRRDGATIPFRRPRRQWRCSRECCLGFLQGPPRWIAPRRLPPHDFVARTFEGDRQGIRDRTDIAPDHHLVPDARQARCRTGKRDAPGGFALTGRPRSRDAFAGPPLAVVHAATAFRALGTIPMPILLSSA